MADPRTQPAEIPGARRRSWSLASAGSALVIAVAALVLIGWVTDTEALKSFGPGLVSMKVNTAVCLALLGAATWARRRNTRGRLAFERVAGTVAIVIGTLTLAEYLLGLDLRLDQLVFPEPATAVGTSSPGRMAPTTALSFVLLGAAFASPGALGPGRARRTDPLVAIAAAIAFLAFVGYLYGATASYGLGSITQMALHTSISLLVLCVSSVAISPQHSIGAVLLRDSAGGVVARRLFPAAVLAPPAVGWFRLQAERAGIVDPAFGLSATVVAQVLIFIGIAAWVAWALDRQHSKLLTAERSADTDALTGLASRRSIVDRLERLVAASERGGAPFSVLAIDADGLKQVNDRYGHAVGDAALVRLGKLVRHTLRDSDIVGRLGGDEFIALLPATSEREARAATRRLRDAFVQQAPADGVLTASVGVFAWAIGVTATDVLEAADRALYEDKRARAVAR